jgi:prepilin-type processing-associated H-X9-DG protein
MLLPVGREKDLNRGRSGTTPTALDVFMPHADSPPMHIGRTPGCVNSKIAAPRGPWKQPDGTYALDSDTTHYPVRRHQGVFTALYCDGHVAVLQQSDLLDTMFKWSGQ